MLRARVPRLEGVWIEPDGRVGLSAAVAWCAQVRSERVLVASKSSVKNHWLTTFLASLTIMFCFDLHCFIHASQGVGGGCDAFAYPVSLRSHLDVRGGGHELAFRDAELLLWSSGGGPAGGVGPARGGAGGGAPPLAIWFPLKLISRTARAGYFIGSRYIIEHYIMPHRITSSARGARCRDGMRAERVEPPPSSNDESHPRPINGTFDAYMASSRTRIVFDPAALLLPRRSSNPRTRARSAALEYVKPNASRDRLEASIVAEVKPAGDGSLGGFEMNLGRDDARITVRRPHDHHRPSGREQMKKRARLSAVRLTFFDLLD